MRGGSSVRGDSNVRGEGRVVDWVGRAAYGVSCGM